MKKAIERVVSVLKGVSTLDTIMRNPRIILLLLVAMIALGGAVRGGHSTLDYVDPSFNPEIQTSSFGCKYVHQIIPLPDGKLLVSGYFNSYNRQPVGGLVRLNADGTLDTTFNSNLPSNPVAHMVVLADGKILVLKVEFNPFNLQLIRLNADGTIDTTFNSNVLPYGVQSFRIDANGRIIIYGAANLIGYRGVFRLNSDGSYDPTFQSQLSVYVDVRTLAAQNNKIIISTLDGGVERIQRLNEDGTIDSSFMVRNFSAMDLIVQPDGKILVLRENVLQRLNVNGSDDTGFTITTFPPLRYPYRVMALSDDGKITLAYEIAAAYEYQVKRLLADGTPDSSFTPYIANLFTSLAVQADGSVLIGDGDAGCDGGVFRNDFVRLLPNGSPDPTFNTGIGFQTFYPGTVRAINVQPDGKTLIGGDFDFVNDVSRSKIARLNEDSTLDPSFQINTSGTGNYFTFIESFYNIRTQSDGKIVATGRFGYFVNGEFKRDMVRLNSDGSIDPTFILGVPIGGFHVETFNAGRDRFVIFNDGKLLVGTSRYSPEQPAVPVKLLASGQRDTSFIPGVYQQDTAVYIHDVAVQPDGKIIIGGWRQTLIYERKSFLTRLNADGSLDATFQTREQLNKTVRAFVLLPNGKIVISETTFPSPNPPNTSQSSVLRLHPDGSLDPTFNAGTGADGNINTMLLLTTGRIFAGGRFSNFNGQPRANLVQLNEDGSVFTPVYNLNNEVFSLAVDGDGRVFVGGNFTVINAGSSGAERSYAAALIDAEQSSTRFDFDGDRRADPAVYLGADGMWSILNRLNKQSVSTKFGLSEDKTVPADFDGDGRTDIAVFRPSDGTWYLLGSQEGFGAVRWGAAEDKPIAGDFDGDRKADFAVWRPSSGVWWILQSSTGEATGVNFGLAGDLPLSQADFDGDRKTDIAVWRPSDGNFYWLASGSGNRFNAVHFGQNGDIPAVADYNGDGKADLVVFRPADGNWHQYLSTPTGEYTYSVTSFGLSEDEPVAADYDGDGKTDIAVRRGNVWHILNSAQGYAGQIFGNAGAQAVAAFSIQ